LAGLAGVRRVFERLARSGSFAIDLCASHFLAFSKKAFNQKPTALSWYSRILEFHGRVMSQAIEPAAYKITEVATLLQTTETQIRKAIRRGQLPAIELGDQTRIPKRPMDRILDGEPQPHAAALPDEVEAEEEAEKNHIERGEAA
jgi:excisionase family DNA binding protein